MNRRVSTVLPCILLGATGAFAQLYTIPSHVVAGGGGKSVAGAFTLVGTVGEAGAGSPFAGGAYEVAGGFWWTFPKHLIFADNFEFGNTSLWFATVGAGFTAGEQSRAPAEPASPWGGSGSGVPLSEFDPRRAERGACLDDRALAPSEVAVFGFECGDLSGLVPLDAVGGRLAVGQWAALGQSRLGLELAIDGDAPAVGVVARILRPASNLVVRLRLDPSNLVGEPGSAIELVRLFDGDGAVVAALALVGRDGDWSVRRTAGRDAQWVARLGPAANSGERLLEIDWREGTPIAAVAVGSLRSRCRLDGALLLDDLRLRLSAPRHHD